MDKSEEHGNIVELNRAILVLLIEQIIVEEDQRIHVRFRYTDQYERSIQLLTHLSKKNGVLAHNIRKQRRKGGSNNGENE